MKYLEIILLAVIAIELILIISVLYKKSNSAKEILEDAIDDLRTKTHSTQFIESISDKEKFDKAKNISDLIN